MEVVAPKIDEQPVEVEAPEEVLEPSTAHRTQKIGQGDYEFEFTQKPLSFIGKLDFFAVLGKALDKVMSGPDGVSIGDLLDVPTRGAGEFSAADLADADTFVKGISKLLMYSPEIVTELYCVLLAVPKGHRELVRELMGFTEEEGGLSDDDGVAIFQTAIDQNLEVMTDFFKQRIAPMAEKIGAKMATASESSKP